jgi:hypothetical protein
MSKGHGKVQRALLQLLRDYETSDEAARASAAGDPLLGLPTKALAARVYMWPSYCLTEAQKRAARRALRGLARQGLIVGPLRMHGIQTWRWNVSSHPLDR